MSTAVHKQRSVLVQSSAASVRGFSEHQCTLRCLEVRQNLFSCVWCRLTQSQHGAVRCCWRRRAVSCVGMPDDTCTTIWGHSICPLAVTGSCVRPWMQWHSRGSYVLLADATCLC